MKDWKKVVRRYSKPVAIKSWWQVANTFIPFILSWSMAFYFFDRSLWASAGFIFLAALFRIRLFIIMHDCGHGSFFKSSRLRTIVGHITGVCNFTPYHQWTAEHAAHHNTSGNLDKRGRGDIWTLTAKEYQNASAFEKLRYRLYRNPVVTFIIGPFYIFFLLYRFTAKWDGAKERRSVHITNFSIVAVLGTLSYFLGFKNVMMVELPILYISSFIGVLLFYVQHQYEMTYWKEEGEWDYFTSAMEGSSYLKLPKVLQWFSGNIGIHHIHHLSHKIPNYNLQKCMDENVEFQNPHTITIGSFLKCFGLHLWDSENGDLISFKEYKKRYDQVMALEEKVA